RFQGPTMGTTYSVVVPETPQDVTRDSLQSVIDAVLAESNRHLSTYDPTAELARFNASAGTDPVPVSQLLFAVLSIALEVSAATDGAFDVTVGPLVQRWGFGGGSDTGSAPDPAEIAVLRESIGYRKLQLEPQGPSLGKSVGSLQVDVGAVAPGWA